MGRITVIKNSCMLLLKATIGVTIALVLLCERKRRQPGFAADDPAFVGWNQLVRRIQGTQVHFDFVRGVCENRRAAARTERAPGIVTGLTIHPYRILREHGGSIKKSPMMLAAVEAVTKADPVWAPRRFNSNFPANATTSESVQNMSPPKQAVAIYTTKSTQRPRKVSQTSQPWVFWRRANKPSAARV
jgi:hypothetical protein